MNLKYRFRQISSALSSNKLLSRANKLRRQVNRNRKGKPKKSKLDTGSNFSIRGINLKRMVYSLGVFSLVMVALGSMVGYLGIETHASELDWYQSKSEIVGGEINIAVIVIEESNGYQFIDFLSLLSLERGDDSHKAVVINPQFATRALGGTNDIRLSNIFSNAIAQNTSPIDSLNLAIELLLGLKVDRYVLIDKSNLENVLAKIELSAEVEVDFADLYAGSFVKGEIVSGDELVNYLAAGEAGWDVKLSRQAKFLSSIFQQQLTIDKLASGLINLDYLIDSVETNLDRDELISAISLINSKPAIDTEIISVFDGFYIQETFGGIYLPNYISIDTKIKKLFSRLDVQKEQAQIEIYNGTQTGGLASRSRRLIENRGGNVIRAANSPQDEARTILYLDRTEGLESNIELVRQIMNDRVLIVDEPYPEQHVGELVLVIGEDYVAEQ